MHLLLNECKLCSSLEAAQRQASNNVKAPQGKLGCPGAPAGAGCCRDSSSSRIRLGEIENNSKIHNYQGSCSIRVQFRNSETLLLAILKWTVYKASVVTLEGKLDGGVFIMTPTLTDCFRAVGAV